MQRTGVDREVARAGQIQAIQNQRAAAGLGQSESIQIQNAVLRIRATHENGVRAGNGGVVTQHHILQLAARGGTAVGNDRATGPRAADNHRIAKHGRGDILAVEVQRAGVGHHDVGAESRVGAELQHAGGHDGFTGVTVGGRQCQFARAELDQRVVALQRHADGSVAVGGDIKRQSGNIQPDRIRARNGITAGARVERDGIRRHVSGERHSAVGACARTKHGEIKIRPRDIGGTVPPVRRAAVPSAVAVLCAGQCAICIPSVRDRRLDGDDNTVQRRIHGITGIIKQPGKNGILADV